MPSLSSDPDFEARRERRQMSAYRLAFVRACREYQYQGGPLLSRINMLLSALPNKQREDWENITIFERWRPEIKAFLQSESGLIGGLLSGNVRPIQMTDAQVDDLFRLAMQIESGED